MTRSTAIATADAVPVHGEAWPSPKVADTHPEPDRAEFDTALQPLVISAAWWLLIAIAVIQSVW
jgi:hypothetical protein